MFILHSEKSQLVETYFNGSRQECGILEVEFEDKFWQMLVNRILQFINYFHEFRKSPELQRKLLQQGVEKFEIDIY